MPGILKDLDVVEILRVGLGGLCFLLSLLAFWLIWREQSREGAPRKGILRAIYSFMIANLVSAILVALVAQLVPQRQETIRLKDPLESATYLTEFSSFLVDLTKWTPETLGPVLITRTDSIRKIGDQKEDYVVPFFTTGQDIQFEPLTYSTKPTFVAKDDPDKKGKHFDYRLPIAREPSGHTETLSTRFTFPNGFRNPEKEWWQASIAYPSRTISVTIRFPADKPCKDLAIFRISGIKAKEPIIDIPASISYNGEVVAWTGLNEQGNTRIEFDWQW
jgi:hypothetical protein